MIASSPIKNKLYTDEKYILFQKPYQLSKADDPNAKVNGIYIECNGDSCFNCCERIEINNKRLTLIVQDSEILIDIEDLALPSNFVPYLKDIFGDSLRVDREDE